MTKLTENEILWLEDALTPKHCSSCIWRKGENEKYHCFPNGEAPCQLFVDKVFQGLEIANLI